MLFHLHLHLQQLPLVLHKIIFLGSEVAKGLLPPKAEKHSIICCSQANVISLVWKMSVLGVGCATMPSHQVDRIYTRIPKQEM